MSLDGSAEAGPASPVRIIGMSVDNGQTPSQTPQKQQQQPEPASPMNGDLSYVSDMSDAAPAPLSPAATPMANGTATFASSPRSPLSSSSIHSPDFHDFTSPEPADAQTHEHDPAHPHPHPSDLQTVQETRDAESGHSHMKPLAAVAQETFAAAAAHHNLPINTHAPWSPEDAGTQHPTVHIPTSPSAVVQQKHSSHATTTTSPVLSSVPASAAVSASASAAAAAASEDEKSAPSNQQPAPAALAVDGPSSTSGASGGERRPSVLARVDRWGNIRAGETNGQQPQQSAKEREKRSKRLTLDQEREAKWVKMVADWERTIATKQDKVKRRIRKGIPDSMRAAVWPRLAGALELMKAPASSSSSPAAAKTGPGVYARYAHLPSKEQDTIARDIARTFPHHVLFRDQNPSGDPAGIGEGIGIGSAGQGKAKGEEREEQSSQGRNSLFNVLKAYSLHDEQTGYCQGMGFPAGLFLMYLTEEEAFWMLHCIARGERYLFAGLWSPGFPLLFQCFYQHAALLKKHCPKLAAHLLAQEPPIVPELYATHWFMTLFSYNLPFDVVLRVWDILLAEGPKIIFRLAIFFCRALEKEILRERDFAAIMDQLKNIHTHPMMDDPDAVIQGALDIPLTNADLSKLANRYQADKFKAEQDKQRAAQKK